MRFPVKIRITAVLLSAVILLLTSACSKDTAAGAAASDQTASVPVPQTPASSLSESSADETSSKKVSSYIDPRPIESRNCGLLDASTGELVDGKYIDDTVYPASIVKLMTLLVADELCEDKDNTYCSVTYSQIRRLQDRDAYRVGLAAGEKMSVTDLMYCAALSSGADAAVALAAGLAGSEADFVDHMNRKAAELGLNNTVFANCTGLHSSSQISTVTDMALLMKYAMESEFCRKVLTTYSYTTSPTSRHGEGIKCTSNALSTVKDCNIDGRIKIIAGKTGFIRKSLYCMVTYAVSNNGKEYIFVSLGAEYKKHTVNDMIYFYEMHML